MSNCDNTVQIKKGCVNDDKKGIILTRGSDNVGGDVANVCTSQGTEDFCDLGSGD